MCNGAMLDQGIDEYFDSCDASLWEPKPFDWENEDHNLADYEDFSLDDYYDYYWYYDNYFGWYYDSTEFDFWTKLMADDKVCCSFDSCLV